MPTQVTITFSNITGTGPLGPASVTGNVVVDYPDLPGQPAVLVSSSLTLHTGVTNTPLDTVTISGNMPIGPFTIHAGSTLLPPTIAHLDFAYTGPEPIALDSASLVFANTTVVPITLTTDLLISAPCFAAGTLIRTPRGDVAIETLKSGDVIVTASGEYRPIKWVGHRIIQCLNHRNPKGVLPIRIAADAFGPDRPSQDLFVSPGHSICVDLIGETFILAGNLVNGASIAQVEVDEIDYWHVELDSHDVLLANNLPAESYLEMANRALLSEDGVKFNFDLDETVKNAARTHDDFCRPVMPPGPVLDFVRSRLLARAEAIGWTRSRDAGLHLVVDGEIVQPIAKEAGLTTFRLPAGPKDVRLLSNTFVPQHVGLPDARLLGVSLVGLAVIGWGETREIALTDPRLADDLHPLEGRDGATWRWTKGELKLSAEFFAGLTSEIELRVKCNNTQATRAWVAPMRSESRPALRLVKAAS